VVPGDESFFPERKKPRFILVARLAAQ
jgi:hypothetical protein